MGKQGVPSAEVGAQPPVLKIQLQIPSQTYLDLKVLSIEQILMFEH